MDIKKVVIKIHEDGQIEIATKDKGVQVLVVYPDGAEVEVIEDGKTIYEG